MIRLRKIGGRFVALMSSRRGHRLAWVAECMVALFFALLPTLATSKVYRAIETALTFKSSGGSAAITCTSLANNAGRVSAQYDRGAGSLAQRFLVECEFKCVATPTLGATITVYIAGAQANSASPDGNVGTTDAALSALDKRRNLMIACVVEIDVAGTGLQKGTGIVEIPHRYISAVVVNEAGSALSATAGDTVITLTPIPDENQ